jgi:hypothetical protein
VEEGWLKELISSYLKTDDVFQAHFLSTVVFTGPSNVDITAGANKFLQSLGTTKIDIIDAIKSACVLPPGPYLASDQCLFEICRLYEDSQGAFLTSLVPGSNK